MPLLNFKKQFVPPMRAGVKNHTIRGDRKFPIKVGDILYCYCGARTKHCFKIFDKPPVCTKVLPIVINICGTALVLVDGERLRPDECERLAIADGFANFSEMMQFWKKEHGDKDGRVLFSGQIIHWK